MDEWCEALVSDEGIFETEANAFGFHILKCFSSHKLTFKKHSRVHLLCILHVHSYNKKRIGRLNAGLRIDVVQLQWSAVHVGVS